MRETSTWLQQAASKGRALSSSLIRVVLLTPQIIRVQSPEGVKRITATKRETVATFLKKVPRAPQRRPARLRDEAGLLRLSLRSGSRSRDTRASPRWANVLTAVRIGAPCGKRHFCWCSQSQFSHCCSRGKITKLKKKTHSAFQLEFPGVGAFLGEDTFLVFSQRNGSWGSRG